MSDIVAATRAVSPVPSTGALARRTAARVLATVAIGLGVWLCAAGVATASQHGAHHHPSDHQTADHESSGQSLHIAGLSVRLPGAHAHHRQHATHRHASSHSSSASKASTSKSETSAKSAESTESAETTRHSSTQDSPTSKSAATTAKKTPTHETTATKSTPTKKAATKKTSTKKSATKRTETPVRSETAPRPTKEHKSSTTTDPAPQDSTTGGGLLGTGSVLNVVTKPVTDVTSSLLAPKPHNPSAPAPGGGGIFTPPANDSNDYSGDQQDSGGAYTTQEITAPEQVAKLQRPANAPRVEHHATTASSKTATVHATPKRTTTENAKTVAPQHKQAEPTTTTQFVTTTEAPAQVATDHAQPPASNHPTPSPQPEPLPAPNAPTVAPAHSGLGNDRTPLAILPPHAAVPLNAGTIALHSSPAHAESALLGLPNTAPD